MHRISGIEEFSKAKSMIRFEDGTCLVVYKGMCKNAGDELTDEEYDRMVAEMVSYGKKRAMNLLIKKDYSRRALEKKLEDDGYDSEVIEKVTAFLDSYHYLDDRRIADNVIRYNRNLKSKAELRFMLKKRDIPDDIAEAALDEMYETKDDGEDDGRETEIKAIVNLLKKLGMTPERVNSLDYKERQKLAAKFFRKGFKAENITKALKLEEYD